MWWSIRSIFGLVSSFIKRFRFSVKNSLISPASSWQRIVSWFHFYLMKILLSLQLPFKQRSFINLWEWKCPRPKYFHPEFWPMHLCILHCRHCLTGRVSRWDSLNHLVHQHKNLLFWCLSGPEETFVSLTLGYSESGFELSLSRIRLMFGSYKNHWRW